VDKMNSLNNLIPHLLSEISFDTQTLLMELTTILIHKQIGDKKDGQSAMHQM